jgi:hypothetical protein
MQRRRTVAWIAGSLLLAGIVLLLAWIAALQARHLNVENFSEIRPGMTQAEVERLLGGPPGNYGRYSQCIMTLEGYIAPPGSVEKRWRDDAHCFEIYFDQEDRVVGLHKRAGYGQHPGNWLEHLCSRVGW